MTRKNVLLPVLKCDWCSFCTKNNFIYKRHRIRCRKEFGTLQQQGLGNEGDSPGGAISRTYKPKRTKKTDILPEDTPDTIEDLASEDVTLASSSMDSKLSEDADCGASGGNTNGDVTGKDNASHVSDSDEVTSPGADKSGAESEGFDEGDETDQDPGGKKVKPRVSRNYSCAKCGLQTQKSRAYLYHLVQVHNSSTDIFACLVCEYCSRYRHKIQRHMKFAHKVEVPFNEIKAEHEGKGRRKVLVSKAKKPLKMKMKSLVGKRLTVKFTKPSGGGVNGLAAPVEQGQKSLQVSSQSLDQLSRVVEQVVVGGGTIFKCKECQFTNDDKLKVARHAVSWHVDTKSFTCSHCDYISFDRNDFLAHRITHRNEHQFRCEECTYSTDFRPNFDRHMNNHKGSFPFKCSFCSYGCGNEAALRRHMASNHDPVPPPQKKLKLPVPKSLNAANTLATASECDTSNSSKCAKSPVKVRRETNNLSPGSGDDNLSAGLLNDSVEFQEDLLIQFNKSSLFDSQSASMVPRPVIPLPEGVEMDTRELSPQRKVPASILKHVERDDNKLVCPACKLKYKRSSDLNRHMKRKHGCRLREYLEVSLGSGSGANLSLGSSDFDDLDTGNPEESMEEDLNDDYLVGNGGSGVDSPGDDEPLVTAEQVQCKYCDYRAKWPSDLKRHMAVHSIEKRYKCNFCSKKYKYIGDMNVHIRKDHKAEPDQLKIKRVTTVTRKNSSPALFKCPCCEYTSTWKSEVDRHSQIHTGEKKFQCANCDYQTFWRGDIRRHIYRHHPGVMAEGVAIDDVIRIRKDKSPDVNSPAKPQGLKTATKATPPKQNVGVADIEMSEGLNTSGAMDLSTVGKSTEGPAAANHPEIVPHSPSPSPIKEIGGGQYECQYCGFIASAPSKMNSHIATHTNLKRYMCPICGRRANWKWDIAKHIRTDHGDQPVKAIKLSRKEAERTIHSYIEEFPVVKRDHHLNLTQNKIKPAADSYRQFFKCSQCDFSAEVRISVARHIRYMHKGQEVNILMVRKKLKKKQNQDMSLSGEPAASNSVDNASLSSDVPSVSTGKLNQSSENTGQQDGSRPFMCSECGKRGATKGDIKKHYHYLHADKEIRIIYLGDGSPSVVTTKPDGGSALSGVLSPSVLPQMQPPSVYNQSIMASPPMSSPPKTPPSFGRSPFKKLSDNSGSKQPKALGYIKPFKCGLCGRRSNWRWDTSKHIRERHPGMNVQVITLSEEEARATMQSYVTEVLPMLNKTSNSVPRKSPEKSASPAQPQTVSPLSTAESPSKTVLPKLDTEKVMLSPPKVSTSSTTSSSLPKMHKELFGAGVPSKGVFRQLKCSACAYRSNWRADITRHIARRHSLLTHARLIMMDKETAEATLHSYNYRRGNQGKAMLSQRGIQPSQTQGTSDVALQSIKQTDITQAPDDVQKERSLKVDRKFWRCSLCPYTNEDKVDCLRHLGKHNMKAYRCTICNWTSNFRSGVYRHIQLKHAGDDNAFCRLCIKLVKEAPGSDASGKNRGPSVIVPDAGATSQTSAEKVKGDTMQNSTQVKNKFQLPRKRAADMQLIVKYCCKMCPFKSDWRSCVCRHVRKIHKSKDYRTLCVKKIVRGAAPVVTSHIATTSKPRVPESPNSAESIERSRPRNFACTICPYRTYKAKMLNFHMRCHTPQPGVKQAKCKFCPYYVNGGRLLSQHLNLHLMEYRDKPGDKSTGYPVTPVKKKTSVVPQSPQSPAALKRHRCEKCPYTTNSKNDFLYHKQFHRPKPTADFKCDYCDYWVSHRRLIKQHMKVHEEDQGNSSSNFSEVATPTKSEYSDTSVVFDAVEFAATKQRIIASKITPSISQSPLVSPMKIASSCSIGGKRGFLRKDGSYRKIHRCRHCPYMNIRLRNLKLHELMHGKRSASHPLMKCPECDYFVGSKGLLGHHLKVHQPNYDIDVLGYDESKLENGAGEDAEMEVNISMESKVDSLLEIARFKKYGCEKCPYGTSKRAHFQRHVELHGSKQKCKCDFCDYSVPTMNLLNQHTRLHFEPNQNLLAAQSILNLQRLPEMPADVALASMMVNNDTKHPISVTHDHVDLYENALEDMLPKKLYRCDRCPYANVRRDHLLAHLRCHMIKNEFACPYCDYSVGKTHVLMQHVKVHFSPLPEFCEWLTENGDPARMKEAKDKNMKEAINVVKLFQSEREKEAQDKTKGKDGAAENVSDATETKSLDKPGCSSENGKYEKDEDMKKENRDDSNSAESKSEGTKQSADSAEMEVDGDDKDEVQKVVERKISSCAVMADGSISKLDGTELELSNGSSAENEESNGSTNGQTDGYVCQYCDRDFPTSDCLVRHEMQHLIGSSYKEVVQQLMQQTEQISDVIVVDDEDEDTCKSNPASRTRLAPDESMPASSVRQLRSDSTETLRQPSSELNETGNHKAEDMSIISVDGHQDEGKGSVKVKLNTDVVEQDHEIGMVEDQEMDITVNADDNRNMLDTEGGDNKVDIDQVEDNVIDKKSGKDTDISVTANVDKNVDQDLEDYLLSASEKASDGVRDDGNELDVNMDEADKVETSSVCDGSKDVGKDENNHGSDDGNGNLVSTEQGKEICVIEINTEADKAAPLKDSEQDIHNSQVKDAVKIDGAEQELNKQTDIGNGTETNGLDVSESAESAEIPMETD